MHDKMRRCKEWASSVGPAPWQDLNEAANRMGVRCIPKPRNYRSESRDSRSPGRRARSEDGYGSPARRSRDKARYRTPDPPKLRRKLSDVTESPHVDSPLTREGDVSTRVSDGEIKTQRMAGSTDGFSQGRPALSTEGWNQAEPSIGASDEKDKLTGLGKKQLSSVSLKNALMKLHKSITGKASIQHAFYDFDKNHDNQISLDEFLEECSNLKTALPKNQLSEVCEPSPDFFTETTHTDVDQNDVQGTHYVAMFVSCACNRCSQPPMISQKKSMFATTNDFTTKYTQVQPCFMECVV